MAVSWLASSMSSVRTSGGPIPAASSESSHSRDSEASSTQNADLCNELFLRARTAGAVVVAAGTPRRVDQLRDDSSSRIRPRQRFTEPTDSNEKGPGPFLKRLRRHARRRAKPAPLDQFSKPSPNPEQSTIPIKNPQSAINNLQSIPKSTFAKSAIHTSLAPNPRATSSS